MGLTRGAATCLFEVLSILKSYVDGKPRPWTHNRFHRFQKKSQKKITKKKSQKKIKMETDQGRLGRVNAWATGHLWTLNRALVHFWRVRHPLEKKHLPGYRGTRKPRHTPGRQSQNICKCSDMDPSISRQMQSTCHEELHGNRKRQATRRTRKRAIRDSTSQEGETMESAKTASNVTWTQRQHSVRHGPKGGNTAYIKDQKIKNRNGSKASFKG